MLLGASCSTHCKLPGLQATASIFDFQSKVEEMDKLPYSLFIVFNATLLVKCKIAKYIVVVKGDNLINSAEL